MSNSDDDTEELLDKILPMAIQGLSKYGEFAPVGLAIDSKGKIVMVMAADDESRSPPTTQGLVDMIKRGFVEGARSGEYEATALAYEALVTRPDTDRKFDAIAVALDHRDGYSSICYFPYTIDGSQVNVDDDAAFALDGDGKIFPG